MFSRRRKLLEYLVIGLFALALLGYLMYALLRPERF
ncbi:MAG: K(+)-transporting ATPase subunit F [Armatimonadetes bacterium]|nr:K(+)-transporting ATPase subunit F [Armatimonadota bacterium]